MTRTPRVNVSGQIENHNLNFLVNTGATVTIIGWDLFQDLHHNLKFKIIQNDDLQLTTANGGNLDV